MTVTYYPHIATVKKGVLLRLLLHWKGSLYKLVLPEIVAFLILYATLSAIYRYALTSEQKSAFEGICIYLHEYVNSTSITFSLGFFVSFVMNRWWETFKTMPWLFTPAYVIRQIIQPPRSLNQLDGGVQANSGAVQGTVNPQLNSQMNNVNNVANVHANNEASFQNLWLQNLATKSAPNGATLTGTSGIAQPSATPNGVVQRPSPLATVATSFNAAQPSATPDGTPSADKLPDYAEWKRKGSEHASVANGCLPAPPHPAASGADERRKAHEGALSLRLTLLRYLLLGWIFAIRRISTPVMIRFKPTEKLADATLREKLSVLNTDPFIQRYVDPLITEQEQDAIVSYANLLCGERANAYEPDYNVPLSWAADLIHEARERGFIASRHLVRDLLECFKDFRSGLGMLCLMDQFNIPLVYTQVVALSMYIYFVIVCFAQQFLDPHSRVATPAVASTNVSLGNGSAADTLVVSVSVTDETTRSHHDVTDLYVPVPSVLYLMFLLGWLRVAEVCLNPFGEDDDDFPTWHMLNMNVETAFKIVNVFGLDRVYDGTLLPADRRSRRDTSTGPLSNTFIAATATQLRALRARTRSRRSSVASMGIRERDASATIMNKGCNDSPSSNDAARRISATRDAVQDRNRDRDDGSEHSVYSSYFDEQLETIRRVNYEHLRKKYERPIYLGSALQTEMQQNPASQHLADPSLNDAPPSHSSRVTAFARHLGSALHLPTVQRYASRLNVANARGDAPDDTASHSLQIPLLPYSSSASIPVCSAHPDDPNTASRRPSTCSITNANPPWRRASGDQGTNHTGLHFTAASHLSNSPTREEPPAASHCSSPRHRHAVESEPSGLISTTRSVSQVDMRQIGLNRSDDETSHHSRVSFSTSCASCTDLTTSTQQPTAALNSSPPDANSVPLHAVIGNRHMNRIVEATENDCETHSIGACGPTQAGRRQIAFSEANTPDSDVNVRIDGLTTPPITHSRASVPRIYVDSELEPV